MKGDGSDPSSGPPRAVDNAPGGPMLEGGSRSKSFSTTLLGMGQIPHLSEGKRRGRRAAFAWNSWLSTVSGGSAAPPVVLPPAAAAPIPRAPAPAAEVVVAPIDTVAWERLWLATQRRPWRSLALICPGEGAAMNGVARTLAEVGCCHLGVPVMTVDATAISLAVLGARMSAWIEPREGAPRVLLAIGPVLEKPASLALAQAADAAILCLTLGKSSISAAKQTIEQVGSARFLGSVILP